MLVIFDCDGVLVDSEPLSNEALRLALADLGVELTLEQTMEEFMGRSRVHMLTRTRELLGRTVPAEFGAAYDERRDAAFRAAPLQPVDGIVEALDAVEAAGYATCVASSGDHRKMRFTLAMTGLYDRFAGRIYSAMEVIAGKPDPDLFLYAAAEMGFAPEHAVVVEDAPAGVAAARAAGMRAFGYRVEADVMFDDMRDLPSLLE